MKYQILFAMCTAFILSGCASVKFNGPERHTTQIDRPPIGEIVTAYVGDPLLEKGLVVQETVLEVNKTIDGAMYNVPRGEYSQIGHDAENDYFSAVGVVRGFLADPTKALMLGSAKGSDLCVITIFNAAACYSGDYERRQKVSSHGTSFQQTLIYSGRIGNKIHISYREFSNNLARPAFSNDVVYDLEASKIIGYKGARVEVISADNDSIKYRVLKNFP